MWPFALDVSRSVDFSRKVSNWDFYVKSLGFSIFSINFSNLSTMWTVMHEPQTKLHLQVRKMRLREVQWKTQTQLGMSQSPCFSLPSSLGWQQISCLCSPPPTGEGWAPGHLLTEAEFPRAGKGAAT
jgi:hypothetical protein